MSVMRVILAAAAVLTAHTSQAQTQAQAQTGPEYLGKTVPGRPFTPAVRAGDMVFLSGQLGTEADGTMPADFDTQARNVMVNVGKVAHVGGVTMDDLVKCTVMIADMALWPRFNAVYATYFNPGKLPARSAFGTNGLALGGLIEVECIAYKPR